MLITNIYKKNKASFLYVLTLFLLTLCFSSTLIYLSYRYENVIYGFKTIDWAIAFAVLTLAMSFGLASTTVAALLVGYFLGFSAFPVYTLSYLVAAFIGYFAARFIDKGRFLKFVSEIDSTGKYVGAIGKDQLLLIFLGRLTPVLPFSIMNVLLAALNFRMPKFLIGSFLGMLPRTIVCFWVAIQFKELKALLEEGLKGNLVQVAGGLALLVSVLGIYLYGVRLMKNVR